MIDSSCLACCNSSILLLTTNSHLSISVYRIWPSTASSGGDQKAWDTSVKDNGYEILCVSQFTLCGRLKGNKPDFSKAMPPLQAKAMYEKLLDRLKKDYDADKIKDGVFGALMEVSIQNSGPVTITLDSSKD